MSEGGMILLSLYLVSTVVYNCKNHAHDTIWRELRMIG
jgi:hypothetical protein